LLQLGRFELIRTIGRGGMGIVYEAFDPARAERVALKVLNAQGPSALYQLKHEFRSSAELSHDNLVALYELNVADKHAFFTMELVVGGDVVSFLRDHAERRQGPSATDVLRQLCDGIVALHAAGKLHRDLKPSNVLVTDEGRVVLLDFGLAQDVFQTDVEVAGTPAYMAPEQRRGFACPASDWFSFGKILQQLLSADCHGGASPLAAASPQLVPLAESLLHPEPARRPTADEIMRAVCGHRSPRRAGIGGSANVFVGRSAELRVLERAFARSQRGPVLVLIRGEGGVGKTALMREFVRQTQDRARPLVLSGRCYERESIPFKAFDTAVDELSRHLAARPHGHFLNLDASERRSLKHLFPVLDRAPAFAEPLDYGHEQPHPVELRRRSFEALNKLLRELTKEQPMLLCIDDIQWSDTDSAALLASLLCAEDSPPLLVLASDRTDASVLNPSMEWLYRASATASRGADIEELSLTALSPSEARALANSLFLQQTLARNKRALATRVAAESRGNPLFLRELAHRALVDANMLEVAPRVAAEGTPSFETLVMTRIAALSHDARRMLELVALAGRPLSAAVVAHALPALSERSQRLRELRSARLIHVIRRGDDELLEVEHDRIAEVVRRGVELPELRALNARLAQALEDEHGDATASIAQYIEAGLLEAAAQRARRAGELALAALAFSRAASLFAQALELGQWPDDARASLYHDLALSLEHAGQGLEAGAAYHSSARYTKDPLKAALWEALAADHFVHNGRYAEGMALLRRGYEAVGLVWPTNRVQLSLCILKLLLAQAIEPVRRRPIKTQSHLHLARVKLLSSAGASFEMTDVPRTLYNTLLMLRETEHSADPVLYASARCLRGIMRAAFLLPGGAARGLRDIKDGRAIMQKRGYRGVTTDPSRQLAVVLYMSGDLQAALDVANRCEADLRVLPLPPRELSLLMGVLGCVLWDMGELREARRRFSSFAQEVRDQRDALTAFWIHVHPVQLALLLASGDRAGADALLARQRQLSVQHPHIKSLRWTEAFCRAEAELCAGSATRALALVNEDWVTLAKTGYPILTMWAHMLRARAMLGAAAQLPRGAARSSLLRGITAYTFALRLRSKDVFSRAAFHLMLASRALLLGRQRDARRHLDTAIPLLDERGLKLAAASSRYCRGLLAGSQDGDGASKEASEVMRGEGIADPRQWSLWTLPAFRICEVADDHAARL
jgi:serine/threonine protein kinase/tetratricopeptide (TPR) repeat protein